MDPKGKATAPTPPYRRDAKKGYLPSDDLPHAGPEPSSYAPGRFLSGNSLDSQSLMWKCEKAPLLYSLVEKLTSLTRIPASKHLSQNKWVVGRIHQPYFSVHFSKDPATNVYLFRPPEVYGIGTSQRQQVHLRVTAQKICADDNIKGVVVKHFAVLSHLFIAQTYRHIHPPPREWMVLPSPTLMAKVLVFRIFVCFSNLRAGIES